MFRDLQSWPFYNQGQDLEHNLLNTGLWLVHVTSILTCDWLSGPRVLLQPEHDLLDWSVCQTLPLPVRPEHWQRWPPLLCQVVIMWHIIHMTWWLTYYWQWPTWYWSVIGVQEAGPQPGWPGGGVAAGQQEAPHRRPGHRLGGDRLPQPRHPPVRLQDHYGHLYQVKHYLFHNAEDMKNYSLFPSPFVCPVETLP